MEERKYLDDVPREVQDLLFDEQNEQAGEKLLEIDPNLNVNVEIHDIICRLKKANAAPSADDLKYLKDVPREIQDEIFKNKLTVARAMFCVRKNMSPKEVKEEFNGIVHRIYKANPSVRLANGSIEESEKSPAPGCLLMIAALLLCGLFFNLFESSKLVDFFGPILSLLVVVVFVVGFFMFVTRLNIDNSVSPSPPKPLPQVLPKKSSIVQCKTCKKSVSQTAPECPHCGEHLPGLKIFCPKCRSASVQLGQKGYGALKAAAGALILGPGGLLVGFHGRKNMELKCLSCGNKWKPKDLR